MIKKGDNFIERELSQFKRKYWLAKLLQGALVFAGTGLVLLALVTLVEYFSWLTVEQRTIVFILTVLVEFLLFAIYLLWPIVQIVSKGNALSDYNAAGLIGKNITGVKDKLTNYLELREQRSVSELIDAGLIQKQTLLKEFSFKDAIKLSSLKPFLFFLVPLLAVFLFLWSGNRWFMVEQGASRLIHFKTEYKKSLPFNINMESDFIIEEGQDFELEFTISGEVLPDELTILTQSGSRTATRKAGNRFSIEFKNCLNDFLFKIGYDDVFSDDYVVKVNKKVVVGRVSVVVTPPSYTNIQPYILENTALIEAPQFSTVKISYAFRNAAALNVFALERDQVDSFNLTSGEAFSMLLVNNTIVSARHKSEELNSTKLTVVQDKRPVLECAVDSVIGGVKIFINASDDYGITNASAKFFKEEGSEKTVNLPFQGALMKASIFLSFQEISMTDQLVIEVSDHNQTVKQTLSLIPFKEVILSESELLQTGGADIESLNTKSKKTSKTDKDNRQENRKKAEEINRISKELLKKDSVTYDRMEELSEEILKLMEELDKKISDAQKEITEKSLEDKLAELEKEWMILQTIEQLKKLEQTLDKKEGPVDEKQMEKLQKDALELERKLMDETKSEDVDWDKFEDLQKQNKDLEKETDDANKSDDEKKKSADKQNELKEEMKKNSEELREQLSDMSALMMMESTEKNVALIRRLEIRALKSSKKQEIVFSRTSIAQSVDKSSLVAQREVTLSARNILDSLSALTVSDAMLAQVLMENQARLQENLLEMEKISAEDYRGYVSNQRYLQFGLNDLAAILYDILKSESQSLMEMKAGNKQCSKPKPGKGKKPSLSQQQKELGEKAGKIAKPGKGKDGKQSLSQSELLQLIKGQEQILEQY